MGLSRRRRAQNSDASDRKPAFKKEVNVDEASGCTGYLRRESGRTSGSTHRRVDSKVAKEIRRGLVSMDVKCRGGKRFLSDTPDGYLPPVKPNANLRNTGFACVADTHYASQVSYSLNKKSRWNIEDQLEALYSSMDSDLNDHNLYVFNTEWRPQSRGKLVTRRMASNVDHMRLAANELWSRIGKRSCSSQQVFNESFSDKVAQAQQQRPLVKVENCRYSVNRDSLRRSFEMPQCDFAGAESLQSDFEQRTTVRIEIRKPAANFSGKVSHSRLSELREYRRCRKRGKFRHDLLIKDHLFDADIFEEGIEDEDDFNQSLDELQELNFQRSSPTVFDAIRFTNCFQTKTVKADPTEDENKIINLDSFQQVLTPETEDGAVGLKYSFSTFHIEKTTHVHQVNNERYFNDVNSALLQKRETLRVQSRLASPERLEQLFAGTNALLMSNSKPRKFSVLLQDDLSESVSFEAVSEDKNEESTTLIVRHSFSSRNADRQWRQMTSLTEVTSWSDPFVYLVDLLTTKGTIMEAPLAHPSFHGHLPEGWCCTEVWKEGDAKLAALQALPMFAASVTSASNVISTDDTAVSSTADCQICCSPMSFDAADEFSQRSTALGGCRHSFCNACWVHHITSCLNAGATSVECPSSGCPIVIDAVVLLWFCPQRMLPALASAAFRAWQHRLSVSRFCPRRRCGCLHIAAGAGGTGAMCRCWTFFCLQCGNYPHWPVDCATADQFRSEMISRRHAAFSADDLAAETTVRGKKCPRCSTLIEKSTGCNHMRCVCGQHFCWNCCRAFRNSPHECTHNSRGWKKQKFTASEILPVPSTKNSRLYCLAVRSYLSCQTEPQRLESQQRLIRRVFRVAGQKSVGTQDIVVEALMASYLLQYTCVLLDVNRAPTYHRRALSAVLSVGKDTMQLLDSMHAELQNGRRAISGRIDVELARRVCRRLAELRCQLSNECLSLRQAAVVVLKRV